MLVYQNGNYAGVVRKDADVVLRDSEQAGAY